VPPVAISTHLTPYCAEVAAQEAKLLIARAYRYGGIALVGGDINHMPLGDPVPDWSRVQPYNRASRCLRRESPTAPWRGNRIVGETFRDGEFTDVGGYIADLRQDPSLRKPTGKAGLLRVDQTPVFAVRRRAAGFVSVSAGSRSKPLDQAEPVHHLQGRNPGRPVVAGVLVRRLSRRTNTWGWLRARVRE
jgi:hypothetical protein